MEISPTPGQLRALAAITANLSVFWLATMIGTKSTIALLADALFGMMFLYATIILEDWNNKYAH